jgi:hypothetical protein
MSEIPLPLPAQRQPRVAQHVPHARQRAVVAATSLLVIVPAFLLGHALNSGHDHPSPARPAPVSAHAAP